MGDRAAKAFLLALAVLAVASSAALVLGRVVYGDG